MSDYINEKVQIDFDHRLTYEITAGNVVGATTNLTLRTVTAHNDANTKYVRKFGKTYLITQVTDIEDPIDANMTFNVYANDSTLLGSRTGGGAFSAGATVTSQGCYLEIVASGGAVTVLGTILIDTDIDPGGKDFVCATESIADGDTLRLYLSETTSTYYDSAMKYGGARHTPDGTDALPYFAIDTAIAALGGAHTIVTVLDSENYEQLAQAVGAAYPLQSVLGQMPILTNGMGARSSREVQNDGNNTDTIYVSKLGSDTTGDGTYQNPYFTIQHAHDNLAGRTYVAIMDSEVYGENLSLTNSVTIEPLYGFLPSVSRMTMSVTNLTIAGLKINSSVDDLIVFNLTGTSNIFHCDIYNATRDGVSIVQGALAIRQCRIYNNGRHGIYDIWNVSLYNSHVYNNVEDGYHFNNSARSPISDIQNNFIYRNGKRGIYADLSAYQMNSIEDNTIVNNTEDGVKIIVGAGVTQSIDRNIIRYNGDGGVTYYDVKVTGTLINMTYTTFGTQDGAGVSTGSNTDQVIFADESNNKYGLCLNTSSLKSDGANNDRGAKAYWFILNANDISINGFIFDGQELINNAIYEKATRTGTIIQWCTFKNFNGKAIDAYATADTSNQINNCDLYNNGDGISLSYGGNTIQECICYRNGQAGIYANRILQTFNHITLYFNNYGFYIDINSSDITIINSITKDNSTNGIYSEAIIEPMYCCLNDNVNDNVTVTPTTVTFNITSNPLFISETAGSEDFHLKSTARGSLKQSPCLNAADDGEDMGVYLETRQVSDESWQKFVLDTNPANMDAELIHKNASKKSGALGSLFHYSRGTKRVLPFAWNSNSYMTELQKDMFEYFLMNIPSRENNLIRTDTIFRIKLLPNTYLLEGVNGVLDASAETFTDSTLTLTPNKYKGWFLGIRYEAINSAVITASTKLFEVPGKSWDDGEWDGYYIKWNGYHFLITDTLNSDQLYVSDPDGVLVDGTTSTYIEDYYEILSNTATVFTLFDEYSTMLSGTYNYYIDFIECVVSSQRMTTKQPGFDFTRKNWMTAFQLIFQQK